MRAQTLSHDSASAMAYSTKVFEINPRHPLVVKLLDGCPTEPEGDEEEEAAFEPSEEMIDSAWILHDMAMLNGGFTITDPLANSMRMTKFMQSQLGVESLTLEPEIDPPEVEEVAPDLDEDGLGGINMEDFNIDLDSLKMNGDEL